MTTVLAALCCTSAPRASNGSPARFLYVWAGDVDGKDSDFLAVVDVRQDSPTYTKILTTTPVGATQSLPHHLEYALPDTDQTLFANAHHHEEVFRFDIADAEHPKFVGKAERPSTLRFPHDFVRLADKSLLVGYLRGDGPSPAKNDSLIPGNHGGVAHSECRRTRDPLGERCRHVVVRTGSTVRVRRSPSH